MTTHTLTTAEAAIAYDVHGPLPTADGLPPLFMIGQPMTAGGFGTLAAYFPDRTVVTYDPRGLGRSARKDGRVDNSPTVQADDVHAVIDALGAGPVDMFASSGGAVTALALVAAYPDDVVTLVAHEPPLIPVLPDAEAAERARAAVRDAYEAAGSNAGMAAFIAMTSWQGKFTDEYFAQPPADPAAFGMPTEDDGSRDSPLLSDRSWAISSYRPHVHALAAAPTRVVIAVGKESDGTFTGRSAAATAELLGQHATVFPSHHGGFLGGESGYPGQPEAFASKLRDVLNHSLIMHPFRAALEAHDRDAAVSLLAEDVEFRSPVVFKPYHGRDAVATILAGVFQVLRDWTCQREIGGPDQPDHALVFKARIDDKEVEGCDFLHVNDDGLIDEFYVMVRPLSAALALAEAMKAQLAAAQIA